MNTCQLSLWPFLKMYVGKLINVVFHFLEKHILIKIRNLPDY